MKRVSLVLVFTLLCGVLSSSGCSSKPDGPPVGDDAVLRNLASQMPDNSGNAKSFKAFFATGATVPDEAARARYKKLYFKAVGSPSINGDTATVKVEVRDDDIPQPLGQVDWTFVKENSQWKVKTAPLP